jgi:hypothetical protein
LRDFRLVRRVGGQKFAALNQVIDGGGDMMMVGAGAEEKRNRGAAGIFGRQILDGGFHFDLAGVQRQIDQIVQQRRRRHVLEKPVDADFADGRQHGLAVVVAKRQITHFLPQTFHELFIGRGVQQNVKLGGVRIGDFEEPAAARARN